MCYVLLGIHDLSEGRGLSDDALDDVIGRRLSKFVAGHEFKIQLPEFLFENAILTIRPGRGLDDLDVEFPKEPENQERSISAGNYFSCYITKLIMFAIHLC